VADGLASIMDVEKFDARNAIAANGGVIECVYRQGPRRMLEAKKSAPSGALILSLSLAY
jgi:hypothetical protein